MDNKENTQEFSLEEIMREFGSGEIPEPEKAPEQTTKVLPDLTQLELAPEEVTEQEDKAIPAEELPEEF